MTAAMKQEICLFPCGYSFICLNLWFPLSGALLPNRGAMFPALKSIGLSDAATRRAWAALRKGAWQMPSMTLVLTNPGCWRRRSNSSLKVSACHLQRPLAGGADPAQSQTDGGSPSPVCSQKEICGGPFVQRPPRQAASKPLNCQLSAPPPA